MVEIILGIGSFEISLDKAITFDDISGAISIDKIGGLAEALSEKADKSDIPTVDVDKEYVDEQIALQNIKLNAVKSDVEDHEERIEALENKTVLVGSLPSGSTEVVFEDPAITSDSTLDFYTDKFGVNPTDVIIETGKVTLIFDSQGENHGVKVVIS